VAVAHAARQAEIEVAEAVVGAAVRTEPDQGGIAEAEAREVEPGVKSSPGSPLRRPCQRARGSNEPGGQTSPGVRSSKVASRCRRGWAQGVRSMSWTFIQCTLSALSARLGWRSSVLAGGACGRRRYACRVRQRARGSGLAKWHRGAAVGGPKGSGPCLGPPSSAGSLPCPDSSACGRPCSLEVRVVGGAMLAAFGLQGDRWGDDGLV
jgi:hypothetical protein